MATDLIEGLNRRCIALGSLAMGAGSSLGVFSGKASATPDLRNGQVTETVSQAFALMLGLIRQNEQNAVRAARALSYLAVAIHEVHGVWTRMNDVSPGTPMDKRVDLQGLLANAARQVLMHFFPRSDHAMLAAWAAAWTPDSPSARQSETATTSVASVESVLVRSLNDGSQARWSPKMRPESFAGIWQPTFPLFAVVPLEGMAPFWTPWVVPSTRRYVPPQAARPGSQQHRAESREVLRVAQRLTDFQRERARWWNLDSGSVTPAGVWLRLALQMFGGESTAGALAQRLQVLRDVCVAMHDANIACWAVKLRDWSERPITAIRRDLDPGFAPVVSTPGHPSYVSGHASLSAAAAVTLSAHWPAQEKGLWEKAEEAAMSRLWGGIHFRSDNDEGLRLGRSVALDVIAASTR